MSREYADSKIREALVAHKGNMALARQQVKAWAVNDPALLRGLTRPHLDGIIAYQVERVSSGRADTEKEVKSSEEEIPSEENFGMDLLRAVVATGVPVFGMEGSSSPVKKKQASKQHIDAIHKMASGRQVNPKDRKS